MRRLRRDYGAVQDQVMTAPVLPTAKPVLLERVRLGVREMVSAELARSLDMGTLDSYLSNQIVYEFHGFIYGYHKPATAFDRLKDRLNSRFGWNLRVNRVTNVCPHLNGDTSLHVAFAAKR